MPKLNGKQQHFSCRKFSVGLASVLLSTSFFMMGNGNQAKADTSSSEVNVQTEQNSTDVSAAEQLQRTDPKLEQNKNYQEDPAQKQDNNHYSENYQSDYQQPAAENTKQGAVSVSDSKENSQTSSNKQIVPTVKANIPSHFDNSITVNDMDQLLAAIRDRNIEQIVLNNNIYARGHGAYNINNYGIARTLEITSAKNKRYSLNMGDRFFNLYGANQRGTGAQGWNLIVKNVDVNSDNYYNSPFNSLGVSVADSKQDTLTYSDVNFNGHEFARMDAFKTAR